MDFKSVFNSDFCFDIDALVIVCKISSYCVIDIFFLSEGGGGHAHSSSRNLVFVKKCSSLGGNIFCSQEGYV